MIQRTERAFIEVSRSRCDVSGMDFRLAALLFVVLIISFRLQTWSLNSSRMNKRAFQNPCGRRRFAGNGIFGRFLFRKQPQIFALGHVYLNRFIFGSFSV